MITAALSQRQAQKIPISQAAHIDLTSPEDRKTGPIKYCLYARKSSEDDERQALSIDSQIKAMLELAKREGLEIADVRRESHSAKASGARPVFKQLLTDVCAGMFNGILTWAPDRLSRNAGGSWHRRRPHGPRTSTGNPDAWAEVQE